MEALTLPPYGSSGVLWHPTHAVTDSTKLSTHAACPRRNFYEYGLGWRPDTPSIHLGFGSAAHAAKERLLWLLHRDGCYKKEHIDECMALFETEYRKNFPPEDDEANAPKNPELFRWALEEYIKEYRGDRFEVLYTEVAGAVPLDAEGERLIHFKIDAIVRDPGEENRIVILDHKTTTASYIQSRNWDAYWSLTIQFFTYSHVGRMLFGDDFWGVKIDGVGLSKRPRIKKDGEVYKGDEDKRPIFRRANVRFAPDALEKSYWTVFSKYAKLERDWELLKEDSGDAPVMRSFEENWNHCSSYGGCPFFPYCRARSNPLAHSLEPPIGFRKEFWDPRSEETDAKALVRFDEERRAAVIEPKKEGS